MLYNCNMGKKMSSNCNENKKINHAPISSFFKKKVSVTPLVCNRNKNISHFIGCKDSPIEIISSNDDEVVPPTPQNEYSSRKKEKYKDDLSTPLHPSIVTSKKNRRSLTNKKVIKTKNLSTIISDPDLKTEKIKSISSSLKLKVKKSAKTRCSNIKDTPEVSSKEFVLSKQNKRPAPDKILDINPTKKLANEKSNSTILIRNGDETDFLKGYNCDSKQLTKLISNDLLIASKKKEHKVSEVELEDSFSGMFDSDIEFGSPCKDRKSEDTSLLVSGDSLVGLEHMDLIKSSFGQGLFLLKISEVSIGTYKDSNGLCRKEKLLQLHGKQASYRAVCHLRDDWSHMQIEADDLVYISGLSLQITQCVIDNVSSHFITLYPNTLVSGTSISTGITCERNAVLNERFKMDKQNVAMLLGTMTHDLFEWSIQKKKFSEDWLRKEATDMLCSSKYLELLYNIGIDETEMLTKLTEYFPSITNWWNAFHKSSFGKEIEFRAGNDVIKKNDKALVHIDNVIDVEENIWAPSLGLKGKIDVTVEVTAHRSPNIKKYRIPLELKTGNMYSPTGTVEHRAQVGVYTMLMCERYHKTVDAGLLYYLKTKHMQGVPIPSNERRAILIKRNEMARYLTLERKQISMPGMLGKHRTCKRCFQNQNCMLYHKAVERGNGNTSGVDDIFFDLTDHLNDKHLKFFKKWYELIMAETIFDEKNSKKKHIWLENSQQCEKNGSCFSGMVISNESKTADDKLHYQFMRCKKHFNGQTSLKQIHLLKGDRVIVSEENEKVYNITTGYIIYVDNESLTISVTHKVTSVQPHATFRIDKDNTLSNYKTPLSTLCKMLMKDSPKDEKLCKLIVELQPPSFTEEKAEQIRYSQMLNTQSPGKWQETQSEALDSIFSKLNCAQKVAVEKCLVTNDYLMILGMPGAGKSTTVACLVRALVSMGKTVLLTSYTHSAVDTILIKLLACGFNAFLRLGESSRVNNKIVQYTSKELTKTFTNTYQLRNFYNSQRVVATTCLNINHGMFTHRHFDYCIVDEASQVTLPVCLGPLRFANSFILVGDHNQLPPLVQSSEARENGLETSLFRLLSESHPAAVLTLNQQYRMNEDIMLLTNSLVYNNTMKCGNEQVANARMNLPNYEEVRKDDDFFSKVINPEQPVLFVDTDTSPLYKETKTLNSVTNTYEAKLISSIIQKLFKGGITANKIGVISPYRQQLKVILDELVGTTNEVEVDTIDRYQGKDKECIIISLVRSNSESETGDLLKDWRRINVLITRAKSKLIIVGSAKTVKGSDILAKLLEIIEKEKWVISLQ